MKTTVPERTRPRDLFSSIYSVPPTIGDNELTNRLSQIKGIG